MSGLEGGFFGEKITKDVAKKVDVKEGLLLHISHASLDYTSDSKAVTLYVDNGSREYVICTLKDCGHTPLDLNFSSPVTLKVKGNGNSAVHVSGYWEFMADPEMDFEEDEEDEEVEAPKEVAKKSPKKEKSAPAAAAKKAAEVEAEIEDDDSITPSMLAAMMEEGEEYEEFEEIEEEEEPEAPPAPAAGKKRPAAQIQQQQPPQKKQKGGDGKAKQAKQTPPPQQQQQQQKKGGKKGKKN